VIKRFASAQRTGLCLTATKQARRKTRNKYNRFIVFHRIDQQQIFYKNKKEIGTMYTTKKGQLDASSQKHGRSRTKNAIAIALVIVLFITLVAGCSKGDPAGTPTSTPESKPETTSPVVDNRPEETPSVVEDDPEPDEPEMTFPTLWNASAKVDFSNVRFATDEKWIRTEDPYGMTYSFYSDDEFPMLVIWRDSDYKSLYSDDKQEVRDYIDGYIDYYDSGKIIRKDFVSYNGLDGYEIEYENIRDKDGLKRHEHSFYTVVAGSLTAFEFLFPWDEAEMYADIPPYVFNSLRKISFYLEEEWPADYLPKGTPEYSDGDLGTAHINNDYVHIYIENTSLEVILEYYESLKKTGWDITIFDIEGGSNAFCSKGSWELNANVSGDNNDIFILNFKNNDY